MAIEYVRGDLFDSGAQALVNPVNCVGVMGAGLAKQFKARYPDLFPGYQQLCREGEMRVGVVQVTVSLEGNPDVVLFPTKQHWRDPSQLDWIDTGLRRLRRVILMEGYTSIAIPPLGCGLGGLRWAQVKPLIEQHLGDLDARVLVYAPAR